MKPKNVILIMADDLGYECIAANGGQSYKTPNIDAMARRGVRFTHCFSQPLCTPSRVQIMTGKYNDKNYESFGYLPVGERTFGNLLRDHGYRTCISGKWQLNGVDRYPGGDSDRTRYQHFGFEEACLWQMSRGRAAGERYADPLIEVNGGAPEIREGEYGPNIFCDFGLDFVERNRDVPFFWYYPMVLTHEPFYLTPNSQHWNDGDRHEHRIEYFRDAVEYTDYLVGRIVRRVDELGLADNTLILFTGDNGTHPEVISQLRDVGEYPGGKGGMWIPGTHVPLFALYGNAACPGAVCDCLVDFSDFLPTLAEVANLSLDRYEGLDGHSFLHHVTGTDGPERDWIYCHYVPGMKEDSNFETGRMVYDRTYKLYRSGAVYDMVNDIFERSPLADDNPVVASIRSQYAPIFAGRPSWEDALARMKIVDPTARAGGNR